MIVVVGFRWEGIEFFLVVTGVVLDMCQSPAIRLELLMNALVECWDRDEGGGVYMDESNVNNCPHGEPPS